MPYMNQYRYVNFIYGTEKNRIMTDEPFAPLGQNMQVEATNTAGKSISILTLLQPIVPFIDTNKNSIDVFTIEKEPFYMLIEWVLENNTKVLTGIGMQRKQKYHSDDNKRQDKSMLYDFTLFIIEYEKSNPLDINNIQLMEKRNNRLYCKSIREAVDMIGAGCAGVKTKVFPKSNIKGYKDYLKTFGIYTDEWQDVIAVLNKGESELTKYFDNNKTVEKLMKNVILPAIEENINKAYTDTNVEDYTRKEKVNQIKYIQELLVNYKELIEKNKKELNDYVQLKELEQKIDEIIQIVNKALIFEGENKSIEEELSKLYNSVNKVIAEVNDEISAHNIKIEEIKNEITSLNYQEKSNQYLNVKRDIRCKEKELDKVLVDLQLDEKNINEIKRQQKLIKLKRTIEELAYWEKNRSIKEGRKEKLEATEKELTSRVQNVGYSINSYYKSESNKFLEHKEFALSIKKDIESKSNKLFLDNNKLNSELMKVGNELSKLNEWLELYQKMETSIINEFDEVIDFIEDTLEGKNFSVEILINRLKDDNATIENKIKCYKKELEIKDASLKENSTIINGNILEINNCKNILEKINEELMVFNIEKDRILTLTEKFQIDGSLIFDKHKCIKVIEEFYKEKEENRRINIEKTSGIKKELNFLNGSGNLIPEKVKEELENLNIKPITGLDYLNRQGYSFERKKQIYENNSLLPYSMIITEKEYELLTSLNLNVANASPIPLTFFKDVDDFQGEKVKLTNNVYENDRLKFLIFFDSDMLDDERLKIRISSLQQQLERLKLGNENIGQSLEYLNELKTRVKDFKYDDKYEVNLQNRIFETENHRNVLEINNQSLEQLNKDIIHEIESINTIIKEEEKNTKINADKIKEVIRFNDNYCKIYNEKFSRRQKLSSMNSEIKDKVEVIRVDLDKCKIQDNENNETIKQIEISLALIDSHSKDYKGYEIGVIIKDSIESLLGLFNSLNEKSNVNDINELNKDIQEAKKHIEKGVEDREKLIPEIGQNYLFELNRQLDEDQLIFQLNESEKVNKANIETKGNLGSDIKNLTNKLNELYDYIVQQFQNPPIENESEIIIVEYNVKRKQLKDQIKEIEIIKGNCDGRIKELSPLSLELKQFNEVSHEYYSNYTDKEYKDISSKLLKDLKENIDRRKQYLDEINTKQLGIYPLLKDDKIEIYEILANSMDLSKKQNVCSKIKSVINGDIDRLQVTKQEIENDKKYIYTTIKDYVDMVIRGINRLNDIARVNGERLMKFTLKPYNIEYSIINSMIDNVEDGEIVITNYFTTFNLLDLVAKIRTIRVEIVQYELYNKKFIEWSELESKTTGAQKFCISFILLTVLMEYKRFDEKEIRRESLGKVLVMDNPFGEISESSLLRPVFQLAEKLKVQIISYTHIQNQAIRDSFEKIYLLKIKKSDQTNREYTESELIKDTIDETANINAFFAQKTIFDEL